MPQLWAPWRMTYIGDVDKVKDDGCFFCNAWNRQGSEKQTLLLGRGEKCLIMMNRYPYSCGHLMIAPARHFGYMEEATPEEGCELWRLTTLAKQALADAVSPHGFNIGINQGRVAGAGVLDHLHVHIVPRWSGDINFMPVFADVRVIPQALEETWEKLKPHIDQMLA